MRSALLVVLGLLFFLNAVPAMGQKRVALAIGISKYQNVPRLANPSGDAEAMVLLLKKAGFDVVDSQRDLGISDLRRAIREFSEASRNADVSVIYYAGHGIEVDGMNHLVPADAKLLSDFDIEDETVSLDRVVRALEAARQLKLIILDACRDNPFVKKMKRSVASRSIGRGLAQIEPITPNTLIAFAAKAGAVAEDGDAHSPFTVALLKHIAEPGLDLRLAFGRVRDEVLKITSNRQEPFVYGSLGGETMALVPHLKAPRDPDAEARVDYELAAQVGTKEAWVSFLARHPTGFFADLARGQNAKLAAAQESRVKADDAKREAEEQAALKAAEFKKQLEEQTARQTAEAKKNLSDQAKRELEEARQELAEQAKKRLDDATRQLEVAQQQAEAARRQVEEAKREAVADARLQVERAKSDIVATLAPNPPSQQSEYGRPSLMDPADIARLLQAHLKRVGCNPGAADGNWDDSSKSALDRFNKNAQTKFDIRLASVDALDTVRQKTDRVCPLICTKGQRAEGDRCIQIVCGSGFFLSSKGSCEKRPAPAPKARAAQREQTPRARARSSDGGRCFAFNGKTYCE